MSVKVRSWHIIRPQNLTAPPEAFLWRIRQEPKVIEAFAKLWGTDELVVSFDGFTVSLPGSMQQSDEMKELAKTKW